ncbi:hypothetical protein AGMMS50225_09050 [Betaproteobacteria bacterium]|nr:hypothetical protein AGMMS50225_09050 [Betaproteobacteria bacterium]
MTHPNEYQGSTLQGAMDGIASGLSDREQGVINERDLESIGDMLLGASALNANDGINGENAGGQMLWALSYPEWRAIAYGIGDSNGTAVRSFPSSWWLRSPGIFDSNALAG